MAHTHNIASVLDSALLTTEEKEFDATRAMNVYSKAPTISIAGGEAGTVAIGIASDADDAALSKTAANNRTGITGVQAPALSVVGESSLVVESIGSCDLHGVRFDAVNKGCRFAWRLPKALDRTEPLYFYVFWTSHANAVGDRTITWQVRYELVKAGALNILGTFPLGTLDTEIAAQAPSGGSGWWEETPEASRGVMNANTIASTDKFLHFAMGMSAFDASFTEKKFLLKVIIEYTRRWTPE